MPDNHSITNWIEALKQGDERAAEALWERFFDQLSRIARQKLGAIPRRSRDEEDLALSALHALFAGAKEGRFRRLESRDDVWQLLMLILSRKASNLRRWNLARKETPETDLAADAQGAFQATLEQAIAGVSTEQGIDS